jgi:hypothetical protein
MMGDRTGWVWIGRLLSWIVAGSFLLAGIMFLLVESGITAPEGRTAPRAARQDFVDATIAFFQDEQARWPQELAASLLFALGFAALGALGVLLARALGGTEARAGVLSSTFAVAGTLGVAAQLLYVGVKQVAIDPRYCDCRYAPEQIISQARGLALAEGAQRWLLGGFFVLAALGFWQVAQLSLQRGVFSTWWARLSQLLAVVLLVQLVVPLAPQFELALQLVVFVGASILLPFWAVWLSRQLLELDISESVAGTPAPPERRASYEGGGRNVT